MTFQGDVGGIGLADLLQSLARGRDGILTLLGRDGLQSTLGIDEGMIHLLPEPAEESAIWRDRVRAAWAGDPISRIDLVRMTEIARAHRIEIVYSLLDADSVHFRFTPGPVPKPAEDAAISKSETGFTRPGVRRDAVWCPPIGVDGLLLEYARLKDEAAGLGPAFHRSVHAVLQVLDPSLAQGERARFAAECDGRSSLREIADRLGWALRQMRIVTGVAMLQGQVCEAHAGELLNLAQSELLAGNLERAASRLIAWSEAAATGTISEQDADFFVNEWNGGRLQPALKLVPPAMARSILRRVDSVIFNPMASAERWKEYAKEAHPDPISAFRVLVCQVRTGSEGGLPPMRELLAAARTFNEHRQPMRAAAVLRIAAERQPETPGIRLEIGQGFLHANLPEEGGPWVVEAARALIESKQGEKAVAPLRALIERSPSNREARRLLSRARAGAVRRRLTGKHGMVIVSSVLIVAMAGFVHFNLRREQQRKLALVQERLSDPAAALVLLEDQFPRDYSAPVQKLRAEIEKRTKEQTLAKREAWTDQYLEARTECATGDPLLGLRRAMELPPPPTSEEDTEPWPMVSDLFNLVVARGESALRELSDDVQDHLEQVRAERRISKLLEDLRAETIGREADPEVRRCLVRLDDLRARVERRAEERAAARAENLKKQNLQHQDLLLAEARAHAKAGDHTRSLAVYEELVATDPSGKLATILAQEMNVERKRHEALVLARDLANDGKHEEAKSVLAGALDRVGDYLLPWKVRTVPSGARARFADGTERVTPFSLETAFGEHVSMTLVKEGCEPVTLTLDDPADQLVYLTRAPERWWHAHGRVEALPLAVGEDHILCDRSGTIVRMSHDGNVLWSRQLTSLSGIARTPALLAGQRGKCILLTEDGQAWLCETATGELEGPLALGSPPTDGPTPCTDGVWARFRDGSTALWTTELTPTKSAPGQGSPEDCTPAEGEIGRMVVLRRSVSGSLALKSPWTGWKVEIGEKGCALTGPADREASASIRREGAWTFVAWEAPHAQAPNGRLWIADGLGLRAYKP